MIAHPVYIEASPDDYDATGERFLSDLAHQEMTNDGGVQARLSRARKRNI